MDDIIKSDKRRIITGKPYQLLLFESGHQLDINDLNAEDEDSFALIGRYESDTPFLPIHVGDALDGRPLGLRDDLLLLVETIEHQIDVWHGITKHRLVLYVKTDVR